LQLELHGISKPTAITLYPPLPTQTEEKIEKLIAVISEQQQQMVEMMAVFMSYLKKVN
jgi:hypothetical protein